MKDETITFIVHVFKDVDSNGHIIDLDLNEKQKDNLCDIIENTLTDKFPDYYVVVGPKV